MPGSSRGSGQLQTPLLRDGRPDKSSHEVLWYSEQVCCQSTLFRPLVVAKMYLIISVISPVPSLLFRLFRPLLFTGNQGAKSDFHFSLMDGPAAFPTALASDGKR